MEPRFKEITQTPERFFSILPTDWQEGIVPHWPAYRESARIFVLETAGEVVGGGIIFATPSPDTQPTYLQEAHHWFASGYLYIGYLWIAEQHRDKQLGSRWLHQVCDHLPQSKFWLSIEEYKLAGFYLRNGFQLIEQLSGPDTNEWVLAMHGRQQQHSTANWEQRLQPVSA